MFDRLAADLVSTGYIHRPLPLYEEKSLEYLNKRKKVLDSRLIFSRNSLEGWNHKGPGGMEWTEERKFNDAGCVRLTAPNVLDGRPFGALEEGDCSNYGISSAAYSVRGEDWEKYNRVAFNVFPCCEGVRNIALTFSLKNDGKIKIPDIYDREGHHVVNLKNYEWNECILEISDIPRDRITEVSFSFHISGRETAMGSLLRFDINGLMLQTIELPEVVHGWMPQKGSILYSGSGYSAARQKTALAGELDAEEFKVVSASGGDTVYSGNIQKISTPLGIFKLLDFTDFCIPGDYRIVAGDSSTQAFPIGDRIWEPSAWKTLNFLFCERCGFPVPNSHLSCHGDVQAVHEGRSFIFNGGWHDAGDVSQQVIQSAEVTFALFESAGKFKDNNELLFQRLREEAEWGLDYVLKSRFGDGYRATSVGMSMWTDGFMGTGDDIKARVHNHAFENFMCAGVEAFCSSQLENDKILAARVLECAVQDFGFAVERYEKVKFEESPAFWEHSYMTSESLYMAAASWSASMLYKMTGIKYYAEKAAEFIGYVLECQNHEPVGGDYALCGFFYRNTSKKVIQHFNHQARDQVYMQALTLICETQPEHANIGSWKESVRLYGGYIKALMQFVRPYGMLPSGVYGIDEAEEAESFSKQHLLIGDEAKTDYAKQLENGVNLGNGHYLKRFPVWFSFRGNNAVLLSMGKSASICGRFLEDSELLSIAEEQLQWIVGKNPFGQSMMYGEGSRYAQQYAALPGEMTGELPVGVQTEGNEDLPYWPQMNNATYKEVWTTPAGRWLSILADLY